MRRPTSRGCRLDHRLGRRDGRLEHVLHPVPVRARAGLLMDGTWPSDRLELRAQHPRHLSSAPRPSSASPSRRCRSPMRLLLWRRGAGDPAAAARVPRRRRDRLDRACRRSRRASASTSCAAAPRASSGRRRPMRHEAKRPALRRGIRFRCAERSATCPRARCRALPAPAGRRSRTAPPPPSACAR